MKKIISVKSTVISLFILIAILSVIPATGLKQSLGNLFPLLNEIRMAIKAKYHLGITFSFIQNILHFPFYAVLSYFLMKLLRYKNINIKKSILLTFILAMALSCATEIIQAFLPSRDASLLDLGIDFSGILTGIFINAKINGNNSCKGGRFPRF